MSAMLPIVTDEERRALLADLMERILVPPVDEDHLQHYVDAEMGVFDVRVEMRPEWVAAVNVTRGRA